MEVIYAWFLNDEASIRSQSSTSLTTITRDISLYTDKQQHKDVEHYTPTTKEPTWITTWKDRMRPLVESISSLQSQQEEKNDKTKAKALTKDIDSLQREKQEYNFQSEKHAQHVV